MQGDGDVALAQTQNGGDGAIGQAAAKFERDQVLLAFAECAQGFLELPVPLCIKILLFGIGIAAWRRCGSLQWGHFPMPIPAIVRDDGVASDAEEPRHKRLRLAAVLPGAKRALEDCRGQVFCRDRIRHAVSHIAVNLRQCRVIELGETGQVIVHLFARSGMGRGPSHINTDAESGGVLHPL